MIPLIEGIGLATRFWRRLTPLWLANVAIGLLASLPLLLALPGEFGRRLWATELVSSRWPELLLEFSAQASPASAGSPPEALMLPAILAVLMAAAAPFLQGACYALFAGSIIEAYLGRTVPMGASVRRWWAPMLRLWLLSLPIQAIGGLVIATAAVGLDDLSGSVVVAVTLLVTGGANLLFELARVLMLAEDQRSARQSVRSAIGTVARRPGSVLAVWLSLTLLSASLFAIVYVLTFLADEWPVPLAVLGSVVASAVAIWEKGVRLAAQARLVSSLPVQEPEIGSWLAGASRSSVVQ